MENNLNEQIEKIKRLSGINESTLRNGNIEITQDIHKILDRIQYFSERLSQLIKKDNYVLDRTQLNDILDFSNIIKRESEILLNLSS